MLESKVKFGILGCAGIAEKFCVSVAGAPNAVVHAVGSRSLEKATAWVASNCPGARAYGDYQAVLDDCEVQAVYLPLPTAVRTEWALKAIAKGKHVLTEKPIAANAKDAAQVIKACEEAGLQYMDDSMFMHHERTNSIRLALDDPAFGPPNHVTSSFSVAFPSEDVLHANVRSSAAAEPLGALGDLGWYNVRFSLFVFGYEMPQSVSCVFHESTADGVPLALTSTLRFSGGRTATFDCSFRRSLRQWAEVASSARTLYLDDFVVPQEATAAFTISTAAIGEKALYFPKETLSEQRTGPCSQNAALVRKFSELVLSGARDEFWPHVAMQTQRVIDACMASAAKDGVFVALES